MGDLGINTRVIPVEQKGGVPIWESLESGKGRVMLWLKLGLTQDTWQVVRFDLEPSTKFQPVSAISSEIVLTLGNVGFQVEPDSLVAVGKLEGNRQHWGSAILLADSTGVTGYLREKLPKRGNPYDVLCRYLGC